ncbi:galactan 1,3-beta-galactosidase [Microdochium bolleyi]|uniref:Galactan 1,3-beta-galactosidase n=1 Tax=Microdochium bolleyi TaxID=196109 RepID=A0A136ISE3_9PEZI|nr:galactan 1,3-beta-galactosidase [Microdochium bolleyi]
MLLKTLGLTAILSACAQATLQIVPGATWTATNTGKHVQAHGAGIIKVGSTFYMIGEDKTDGTFFQNINCYSSTNLVEWTYVGALLSRTGSGDLGPNRVVERPKVIFNQSTGKYVLYMHIDSSNYGEAKVGVATGDSVCGQYSYRGSWRPLGFESRDQGLFQDTDGKAYLLTEDRQNGLRINALTSDYLNTTGTSSVYRWNEKIESPAILKQGGYYFMFGSLLTGWDPNDNVYSYATSLSGPWSSWKNFAPSGSKTFNSQTTYILPLSSTTAIYMGDRWHSTNLMRSTYIWLPLAISGNSVTMADQVNWTPNVAGGTWAAGPSETSPEGEAAVLSNGAVTISCTGCSGGKAAGYIGGASGGTVTFNNVRADATGRTTIRIKHLNGNTAQRFADVIVNGASQRVSFLPTQDGNTPGSSVVHANLNAGSGNTIVIKITDGSYGPDVDRIMVPLT